MSIHLFEHNAKAYAAAAAMLAESGKAAVIHPTGTGKSFIAFKLCEDAPEAAVCWLSPSEYIFKTQLENLAAAGAEVPENIAFYTYAKLMLMGEAELEEIRADYIILDEFHRCGAEQWGMGVQRLLAAYPQARLLGLSATKIRYLDNQRDMADELFENNVASELTLGEAIVRGILDPPVYIRSIYAYQKDLGRYEARIKRAKNQVVRDEAEKLLEALRRALDKADGLDVIFQKHMRDRQGKYIVFCAGVEHMEEMMLHVPEWFARVDAAPHVYRMYSDDSESGKAFDAFKQDDSRHLKLLFCIDMLNEGVHVEDVSGVILLRPTVSPIIYKQQIGRALSASRSRQPVIFDIVNNIENLYSIGTIQQEMQVAMTYYRFLGRSGEIVNQQFQIIDEVRDCKRLFDELNDVLTASWDVMYQYAKKYYQTHGNLEVPRRYKTEDGYSLGNWITTQRKVRNGERYGSLDAGRIAKLEAIGMVWDNVRDLSWKRYYACAQRYYGKRGNLNVNVNYVSPEGLALGRWISNLRTYRKSGIQTAYLTPERITALDELGMIWNVPDHLWAQNYHAAMDYYREHGNLEVPLSYVSEEGVKLGVWIHNMRVSKRGGYTTCHITDEQQRQLEEIGMVWDTISTRRWDHGYGQAVKYRERFGDINVPATYVDEDGFALGKWLKRHLQTRKDGTPAVKLTPERIKKLTALGMKWKTSDPWEVRYALAKDYYEAHGDLNVPAQYVAEGVWLNKWLNEQKQIYRGNRKGKTLTAEQIRRLEEISIVWESGRKRRESAEWLSARP